MGKIMIVTLSSIFSKMETQYISLIMNLLFRKTQCVEDWLEIYQVFKLISMMT